jgi:hypothetical protein
MFRSLLGLALIPLYLSALYLAAPAVREQERARQGQAPTAAARAPAKGPLREGVAGRDPREQGAPRVASLPGGAAEWALAR